MLHVLAILSVGLINPGLATHLPPGLDKSNPVSTLWRFANETWIENLAIRANEKALCTSLSRAAIYQVDPFDHVASIVHQFSSTDGVVDISEIESDVFAAVTANVSLTTNTARPGSSKIWRVDLNPWESVSHYQ